MGNPGIFGEKNEIIAISMALKRQVLKTNEVYIYIYIYNII